MLLVSSFVGFDRPNSSSDGPNRLAASAVGQNVMLFRPDDGAALGSLTGMVGSGEQIGRMAFSRTGSYLAADLETSDD
jgi:hypothetical protein